MSIEDARKELWEDYLTLAEKYDQLMPAYEFGFALIQFTTKMLMDMAPKHGIALETIRVATEEGIKWHVEEGAEERKEGKHGLV